MWIVEGRLWKVEWAGINPTINTRHSTLDIRRSLNDRKDVVLAHDHQLFTVELDLGAGVAGEDDLVALLDGRRDALSFVGPAAFADAQHLAPLGLFLGGVGEDDSALGLGLGF